MPVTRDLTSGRKMCMRRAWLVLPVLLFTGVSARAARYQQEREEFIKVGDCYAKDDLSAFTNALDYFVERHKSSCWRYDAMILEALLHLTKPTEREGARTILRKVSIDARDLPHGPLARFIIARSYEEEGRREQAFKEYAAIAAYPLVSDTLEKSDSGLPYARYPTFITSSSVVNHLPLEAAARATILNRYMVGGDQSAGLRDQNAGLREKNILPSTIKIPKEQGSKSFLVATCFLVNISPEGNKTLEITPSRNERKNALKTFLLVAPKGQAVKSLKVEVVVAAGKRYGKALFSVIPFYPVLPEARPHNFAPDVSRRGRSEAVLKFDTPMALVRIDIAWDGVEISRWKIKPELVAEPRRSFSPSKNGVNLVPLLTRSSPLPFARGVNNIRLRYDEKTRTYNMLLAVPEEILGRPEIAPSLYVAQSRDGGRWSVPQPLGVSSIRSDKWPDACYGGQRSGPGNDAFRTVWVSDRRGTEMEELFSSKSTSIRDCRISGYLKAEPEKFPGFPARCHISISSPALVSASGIDMIFFIARAIGQRHARSGELTIKRSGIFYLELSPGGEPEVKTVISTDRDSLDRYLGRARPGEKSPEIAGDAPLSLLVSEAGNLTVAWASDTGKACISMLQPGRKSWQTTRIALPDNRRIHEFALVSMGKSVALAAAIEGVGVVLYVEERNRWKEKVVVFKDSIYPYRVAAVARPDGKVVVAGAPRGIGATRVRVAIVDPATGAVR